MFLLVDYKTMNSVLMIDEFAVINRERESARLTKKDAAEAASK
jgi:hypothetical protein